MTPSAPVSRGETRSEVPLAGWLALAIIYFLWGSTMLAIRVAVQELPPFVLGSWRFLAAAAVLAVVAIVSERPRLPRGADLRRYALTGVLMFLGGNGLLAVGEQHVPSAMAGILIATIPLWMVVFEVGQHRMKPSLSIAAGMVLGVAGVAMLLGPAEAQQVEPLGIVAIMAAAACWAVGSLAAGHREPRDGPLTVIAIQMMTGGLALLVVALLTGELTGLNVGLVHSDGWLALAWLILPTGALTFASYTYALRVLPAQVVAMYPFVNTVVAVLLGWSLGSERISTGTLMGCTAVLAAAILVVTRSRPRTAPMTAV